jgi:hypothetical protein
MTLATILAVDVLPRPFGPVNRNACGTVKNVGADPRRTEVSFLRTSSLSSSLIVWGRYFR